jgi:hypothetical protein
MTAETINTDSMTSFPAQVSAALHPYSPEMNPAEQIWRLLRGDCVANSVFDSLDAAINQAELGLAKMAAEKSAVRRLANLPWISAILKT